MSMMYKKYKIKDLAIVNPSKKTIKDLDPNTNVSFIPMDYVSNEGTILKMGTKKYKDVSKGFTYFAENDILFAKITPCMENGKGGLVTNLTNFVGFGSTEFHVIRANTDIIDPKYLHYIVHSKLFRKQAGSNMTGSAGQKRVPKHFIENYELNVPNKTIQLKVVELLDMMKTLIDKRKESIAKLDELIQAVFLDMFGDPVTNSKRLSIKKLNDMGRIQTGNTPSRKEEKFYGDYVEWIKSDNINTPHHYLTTATEYLSEVGMKVGRHVPENSILVTCIAGSKDCIGNSAIANRTVAFNQQINAITPYENVNPYFLYVQFLVGKKLVQQASTNSMKGLISKSKFAEIPFLCPTYKEQKKFGNIFMEINNQKISMEKSLEYIKMNFDSFLQRSFKGELEIDTAINIY